MVKSPVQKLSNKIKKFHKGYSGYLPMAVMLVVAAVATVCLRAQPTMAEYSSQASVVVEPSCSFTGVIDEGKEHSATIVNGQYEAEIGMTTLRTYCNDANGYEIYAMGYSGCTDDDETTCLTNSNNTKLIEQDTDTPNYISTGLYPETLNAATPSSWSMKLTAVTAGDTNMTWENDFDTGIYHVVPAASTKIVSYAAGTTGSRKTDSSLTATYDTYVNQTQPSGTYQGKVKYTMAQIPATFGKCNPSGTTIGTIICMQDINDANRTAIFNSMEENVQYQLDDARDTNRYYIAKLKTNTAAPSGTLNGYQVWMTQSLNLCIGCDGTEALTSENTDLNTSGSGIYSAGYATDDKGVITWTPVDTAKTDGRVVSGTSVPGWTNDYNIPYSAEGGDVYVPTSTNNNNDTESTSCSLGETVCPHYLRGNYYNWSAAVASNNTSSVTANYTTVDNSICPAGWKLPKGMTASNGYSDYDYLLYTQGVASKYNAGAGQNAGYASDGFNKIRTNPLYFVRAGSVSGPTLYDSGANGYYWSGTVRNSLNAYYLLFGSGDVYPSGSYYRYHGFSVRCMVRL